jgi:septum formation protein
LEEEGNSSKRLILASSSPRRRRILDQLRLNFEVIEPENAEERIFKNPYKTVKYNSSIKAKYIYNHVIISSSKHKKAVVTGFDTIVYFKGRFFGKPESIDEAFNFLSLLSGREHSVITGLTVLDVQTEKIITDSEVTKVKFRDLTINEIKNYLKVEDFFDKAGAYDISGFGGILVEKIKGCFFNVAGLPVFKFIDLLKKIDYKVL